MSMSIHNIKMDLSRIKRELVSFYPCCNAQFWWVEIRRLPSEKSLVPFHSLMQGRVHAIYSFQQLESHWAKTDLVLAQYTAYTKLG